MKITPLDIRQKRFESAFRGFDQREVEAFLELAAGEFEEIVKENIALKEELKRTQSRVELHQQREHTLQETMVTAQRISEDLKDAAKKEAEIIIAGAEHQAEKIVQNAHQKLVQVVEDINELKRQRIQFESQVRGVIDAHHKLLESFRQTTGAEKDWERVEDNVSFLQQKKASASES
ncbi:MAG: DivIVA domain-containing protein [Myxococcaceae bacterium]